MSSTNRSDVREKDDFYETPAEVTRAVLPYLSIGPRSHIVEPFAGRGAIVRVLQDHGIDRVTIAEKDMGRRSICKKIRCVKDSYVDGFMLYKHEKADAIVTNPPYVIAEESVREGMSALGPQGEGAFLLRLNFLGSQKRIGFFRDFPCDIGVLTPRPSFAKAFRCAGTKKDNCGYAETFPHDAPDIHRCRCGLGIRRTMNDSTEYAWFIFGPNRKRQWFSITWKG